jgi:hypothetical protein
LNRDQEGEEMVKLKTELVAGHAVGWAQQQSANFRFAKIQLKRVFMVIARAVNGLVLRGLRKAQLMRTIVRMFFVARNSRVALLRFDSAEPVYWRWSEMW